MFKKKFKRKNSTFFFESCNRVSDTLKPNSTSLMVNETDTDTVELPNEITSVLSEVSLIQNRDSTSLIESLTQKIQSTPLQQNIDVRRKNDGTSCILNSLQVADQCQTTNQSKTFYFEQVLKACGATFLNENSSFLLTDDQAVFSLKIHNHLAGKDEDIDSFLKSLHNAMEKPEVLQKLLTHTLTANECEEARGPVQDSMMRILLNVDCLQACLIDLLIQKLSDIILNGNEEECSQMVCLILRQLRYLHVPNHVRISHKLLEVIHVASINVQREIIFMLPEITPQSEMEDVSLKLMDMLRDEDELTNVIVDAITNFPLKKNVVSKVRIKMFRRLDKCPVEFLPSLIQFIFSKCEEDECAQVINNLRGSLPLTLKQNVMKEEKRDTNENTYLKMTFDILKFSAMASKHVADTWLKVISSASSSTDFRCLDLMMLIILHGNLQGRKNQITSLLRNKIRCLILTATHVNDLFKALTFLMTENFSTVLEIASTLIKSVDSTIANVGAIFYQESFINFNFYMGQSVINELLLHVATGSPHTIDVVLSTLRCICINHKEALSGHTASIMNLFNKVSDLDSSQIRILMHLISDLVFFPKLESSQRWQDETLMFIRKQLTSTRLEANKKGIISALIFAKYGARCETGEYTEHIHNLLGLAMDSPGHCDIKRIFFNDEFASMLRDPDLSRSFSVFWKEKIKQLFPKNLFVRENDVCLEKSQYFSASLQHSICSEEQNRLVLPVADLVLAANTHESLDFPITVIPSALRLLWCCEEFLNLDIFSAAVVVPEVTVLSTFQALDENQKKMIADCLHLCINYLIECLNAFSIHNVSDKALLRMRQVLLLRATINELIPFVPNYSPPCFQLDCAQQKIEANKIEKLPQKGKKRKANKSSINESNFQGIEPSDIEVDRMKGNAEKGFRFGYHGRFRDLHISCFNLLKIDLVTVKSDMSHHHSPSLSELGIHTEEASYLLEDCLNKCQQLLHKPKENQNFSAVNEMNAQKLISHLLEILPSLITKMEIWSAYSKELIDKNEGIYDGSGMHSKESRDVKFALTNALKLFVEIISWSGFRDSCNKSLLKVVFGIILRRELNFKDNLGSGLLAKEAAETARYFSTFVKSALLLSGALSVIKVIRACFDFCPSNPANSRILGDLCLEVLERPWFTGTGHSEKGTFYNQNIDFLIKTYFCSVQNPLETLRKTVTTILNEIHLLVDGKSSLGTMRSVQRCNFPILYRGMCDALVSGSMRELNKIDGDATNIQIWNGIVEIMLALVNIVKVHSSRVSLAALLKRSQSMIQLFFTNGLPAVEMTLRTHPFETLKVLKTLQTVTRFLHSICCHSKVTNDSLVAAHVPTIRAQCERLTLEVKGMLISNKIPMECITIAILKNKDLKGNDILSQESLEYESEENFELLNEESHEFSEDVNRSFH